MRDARPIGKVDLSRQLDAIPFSHHMGGGRRDRHAGKRPGLTGDDVGSALCVGGDGGLGGDVGAPLEILVEGAVDGVEHVVDIETGCSDRLGDVLRQHGESSRRWFEGSRRDGDSLAIRDEAVQLGQWRCRSHAAVTRRSLSP